MLELIANLWIMANTQYVARPAVMRPGEMRCWIGGHTDGVYATTVAWRSNGFR